jgi:hypothetical protein
MDERPIMADFRRISSREPEQHRSRLMLKRGNFVCYRFATAMIAIHICRPCACHSIPLNYDHLGRPRKVTLNGPVPPLPSCRSRVSNGRYLPRSQLFLRLSSGIHSRQLASLAPAQSDASVMVGTEIGANRASSHSEP